MEYTAGFPIAFNSLFNVSVTKTDPSVQRGHDTSIINYSNNNFTFYTYDTSGIALFCSMYFRRIA